MAKVFQLKATNRNDPNYDKQLIDGTWHVSFFYDCERTLCGVQLEGDDGISPGRTKEGKVTCQGCINVLRQVQSIKNW